MQIKTKVLTEIGKNDAAIVRLCRELKKSYSTVRRWIQENDDNLTKAAAMKIIREELGLKDSQILEETEKAA